MPQPLHLRVRDQLDFSVRSPRQETLGNFTRPKKPLDNGRGTPQGLSLKDYGKTFESSWREKVQTQERVQIDDHIDQMMETCKLSQILGMIDRHPVTSGEF